MLQHSNLLALHWAHSSIPVSLLQQGLPKTGLNTVDVVSQVWNSGEQSLFSQTAGYSLASLSPACCWHSSPQGYIIHVPLAAHQDYPKLLAILSVPSLYYSHTVWKRRCFTSCQQGLSILFFISASSCLVEVFLTFLLS